MQKSTSPKRLSDYFDGQHTVNKSFTCGLNLARATERTIGKAMTAETKSVVIAAANELGRELASTRPFVNEQSSILRRAEATQQRLAVLAVSAHYIDVLCGQLRILLSSFSSETAATAEGPKLGFQDVKVEIAQTFVHAAKHALEATVKVGFPDTSPIHVAATDDVERTEKILTSVRSKKLEQALLQTRKERELKFKAENKNMDLFEMLATDTRGDEPEDFETAGGDTPQQQSQQEQLNEQVFITTVPKLWYCQ